MHAPRTDAYLSRIGVDPDGVAASDFETLERLQRAHVQSVPFETLAITGDPFGDREGEGVSLTLPDLYEKVVDRDRGGFCFELNGPFGWLLREVGFNVDRIAARVVGSDGDARPPANHHSHIVSLDRDYVVDVGLGTPPLREPLPLDGTALTDAAGVAWRVAESDRSDAEYVTQQREPGDEDWTDRYLFDATPRKLSFFEAICEYLATAPESPFTGGPSISIATDDGYKRLTADSLIRAHRGDRSERSVAESEWYGVLEREFGIRFRPT
ncbi:arylamine N-acetyltransferase [Halobacteriales archaeon QS_1_67_19]|nr:MAG: arylamine N-acetyltransferase [Halobacteriales archaeon QS_1_67_19]